MVKKGAKKSPVTKEQLYQEQERAHKRRFIQEQFFPALASATESVDEAGYLLQAMTTLVMEEAMETLKTKRMKEVRGRIVKKLCPNDERLLSIEHLVTLFDGQTLFDARGNFEGMKQVLEQIKIDEMQKSKLSELRVNWERYLTKEA